MIASKGDSKMSWRRARTSGWAAFDQKQQQDDSFEPQRSDESFPSLPSTTTSPKIAKTFSRHRQAKSFSSVILPSVRFPVLSEVGSSKGLKISESSRDDKLGLVLRQMKEQFGRADDSLIEDVMAASNNDIEKASSFLKPMFGDETFLDHNNVEMVNEKNDIIGSVRNGDFKLEKKDVSLKDFSEGTKTCSDMKSGIGNDDGNVNNYEFNFSAGKLFDDCMEINTLLGQMTSIPVEPEWEEDDLYLSSRKDALKMMRSASRHSKAATNSFIRGDHISAQQYSLKAREEWKAAKNLNAKASSEILTLRNENNGIWRLDLHGLHTLEAVQAVRERLFMIETQVLSEGSRPLELLNNVGKSDERASHKLKMMWLEVITGIGNHSRGGAALPSAVRSFLADNGRVLERTMYRFDEARPGVIMVRPKFRTS